MARHKVNDCTEHTIFLCPEVKYIVELKKAERKFVLKKASDNISDTISNIIEEWYDMKNKKVA